jgi:hypothetical protein
MRLSTSGELSIGTSIPTAMVNINSNKTGPWFDSDSYALKINFPQGGQGIFMRYDDNLINGDVAYMTFMMDDPDGLQIPWKSGRIRGFNYLDPADWSPPNIQTIGDVADMVCWANNLIGGVPPTDAIGVATYGAWVNLAAACRNQGVMYESSFGDYAEYMEKENPSDDFYIGEIVGVRGGKISRNTEGAEQYMSISMAPIVLGKMPADSLAHLHEKVGFMGQVPVKVRGVVQSGDYIIPSGLNNGEGIAISPEDLTLDQIGMVIGRSWSDSDYEGLNMVNAVIGVKSFEIVEVLKKEQKRLDDLEVMVQALQEKNEAQANALVENTRILQELQGILQAEAKR